VEDGSVAVKPWPGGVRKVNASGYSVIYAFGDSLSDAGDIYITSLGHKPSAPYVNGEFSNGPDLAAQLGLPVPGPSLNGGTDFAYGGAETGTTPTHQANPTDLPSQLAQFMVQYPHPDPNALYAVWIGDNDVRDAATVAMTDPATAKADISASVANIDNFVLGLASMGATHFVIPEVLDIGKTPEFEAKGAQAEATASAVAAQFDNSLYASLGNIWAASQGLRFDIVDTYHLFDDAVANPAGYGLANVTDPVWTGNYTDPNSGVLRATPAAQTQYLFWDMLHPTGAGQAIVASAAASGLPAMTAPRGFTHCLRL
jgi:phospholipase/lecithinase/hemolysin